MTNKGYRVLENGEIIQEGDEYDASINPMKDAIDWRPVEVSRIGEIAPDPQFPAHTLFRRIKENL